MTFFVPSPSEVFHWIRNVSSTLEEAPDTLEGLRLDFGNETDHGANQTWFVSCGRAVAPTTANAETIRRRFAMRTAVT